MDNAERVGWITLKCAFVWVLTKDSKLVDECIDSRNRFWNSGFEMDWKKAWLKLRDAIALGQIRAIGVPFGMKDAVYAFSLSLFRSPRCAIQASDVKNLGLELPSFYLRPHDWVLAGGGGWAYVEIEKQDLAGVFGITPHISAPIVTVNPSRSEALPIPTKSPEEHPIEEKALSFASERLDWKSALIRETIRELWPVRIPRMNPDLRKSMIEERVRQKLKAKAESENLSQALIEAAQNETLGLSTITKAIRDIKEGK